MCVSVSVRVCESPTLSLSLSLSIFLSLALSLYLSLFLSLYFFLPRMELIAHGVPGATTSPRRGTEGVP